MKKYCCWNENSPSMLPVTTTFWIQQLWHILNSLEIFYDPLAQIFSYYPTHTHFCTLFLYTIFDWIIFWHCGHLLHKSTVLPKYQFVFLILSNFVDVDTFLINNKWLVKTSEFIKTLVDILNTYIYNLG